MKCSSGKLYKHTEPIPVARRPLPKLTSHLNYLRNALEVSKATPIAAMYLEHGILPIKYEIEMKQLLFLNRT